MSIALPLRVLVVDDHAAIRIGVSSLIDAERPKMCSAGTAATISEALARTRASQPDVIVLDINLDGEDGLAAIPALQRAAPCSIVVLTSLADPRVYARALHLGAGACVHKTAPAAELISQILGVPRVTVCRGDALNRAGDLSYPDGEQ